MQPSKSLLVMNATIKRPPRKNKNPQKPPGIIGNHKKHLRRQVLCLQPRCSGVLWAVWVDAFWYGSPVFDH